MSDSTDQLITRLSGSMTKVRPAPVPAMLFARWLAGSLIYIALLLLFFGLRSDLLQQLHAPLFLGEVLSLAFVILFSALAALALSFPDMHQKYWLLFAPILPMTLFIAVLTTAWLEQAGAAPPEPPHGIECLLCITFFSLLPAILMIFLMRRQASTHGKLAGAVALLAASGMGCLALRLSENTDSVIHLIKWHYLPIVGFGVIGVMLGQKILKW